MFRIFCLLFLGLINTLLPAQQHSEIYSLLPMRKVFRGNLLSPVPPYMRMDRLNQEGKIEERFTGFFQELSGRLSPVSYTRLHADSYFQGFLLSTRYDNGQLRQILYGPWGYERTWQMQWKDNQMERLLITMKDGSERLVEYYYSNAVKTFGHLPAELKITQDKRILGSFTISQRELMPELFQISLVTSGELFQSDSEHYFYNEKGKLLAFEQWVDGVLTEVEYQYDDQGLLYREIVKSQGVKDVYTYLYNDEEGGSFRLFVVKGLEDEAQLIHRYQFPSRASLIHLSQQLSPLTNFPFYLPNLQDR